MLLVNFPKLCMCANMTVCFLNKDRVFFRFSEGFMTYKNLKSTALEFHFFVFLLEFQGLTMFEVEDILILDVKLISGNSQITLLTL